MKIVIEIEKSWCHKCFFGDVGWCKPAIKELTSHGLMYCEISKMIDEEEKK